MNSLNFWNCLSLSDEEDEGISTNQGTQPIPTLITSSQLCDTGKIPSNLFVNGLILTKDEIISLIHDFNLDPHSSRLNSSLMISSKCADYRPAKAILLCVCHHALILQGKIHDLSVCKSIIEIFKAHSKKPSITMLIYASVISLILYDCNLDQFIEFGLHKYLSTLSESWKYNQIEPFDSSKLSLLCWKIIIIATLTANNLETRKVFGDSSTCETIVLLLEQLLKFSNEMSLSSGQVRSDSTRNASVTTPTTIPFPDLLNTFIQGCCVALLHLTKDYLTNFQKIISLTVKSGILFVLYLDEATIPPRRMQYSVLTDETWDALEQTRDYFKVHIQASPKLPASPPMSTFATSPIASPRQFPPFAESMSDLSQKFTPTSSYFYSLVSMVLIDTISFLREREDQALKSSPDASEFNELFVPYYVQLTCALEAFNTFRCYANEISILNQMSMKEHQNIQETKMELESLTEQLQKEQKLSSSLKSELELIENQLKSAETEHQQLIEKLEEKKIESRKKLENYQEIELAQVESVAAIMNARARAELELEEVSYKHQTELQKVNDIFHLKNPRKRNHQSSDISTVTGISTCLMDSHHDDTKPPSDSLRSLPLFPQAIYDPNETFNLIKRMKVLLVSKEPTPSTVAELQSQEVVAEISPPSTSLEVPKRSIPLLTLPPPPPPNESSPIEFSITPYPLGAIPLALSDTEISSPPQIAEAIVAADIQILPDCSPSHFLDENSSKTSSSSVDYDKLLHLTSLYLKKS